MSTPQVVESGVEPTPVPAVQSATRSGVLLGIALVASIAANYAFLLAAGRILGSEDYGSLAALLGLLTFVLLPAGALQMAVSREISRRRADGNAAGVDAFARAILRLAFRATAPLVAVALALAVPLAHVLHIHSVGIVALSETTFVTALVFPVAMGVLQGSERFHALALMYIFPFVLRLALLGATAAAGYRLGGAVVATVLGSIAGTLLAIWLIREPLQRAAAAARPELGQFLRYLGPVVVGLIGIAFLTQMDILVVKARFSGDAAGAYAAASAFARVAFFVPASILAVLFPRTAARQVRGEDTADILGRSLLVTSAFCAALAVFYAAAGRGLVVSSFGADFTEGGKVLAPFAVAIGLYSLAHILVGYHLSRGETRFAWVVAASVIAQVVVLAAYPTTLREVVWANVAVGGGLLAAHEVLVGSSVPAIRVGVRHFASALAGVRVRRIALEAGAVLFASTVFVCLLFWPLVIHLGSTVVGRGSDGGGAVGFFWELQHEGGYHLFGQTHHTLTGAPWGWDQANGLNVQWLLPYYAAYLLTKVAGPIVAYNLVLLAGYVLSAAAMYLLVRYLGCGRLVATWAAVVYVVFPWHLARTPHASLVHLEFLPLLLLTLVAAARRPSWSRYLLVALATLACWLTAGYFGAMALVAVGAFALCASLVSVRGKRVLLVAGSTGGALTASALVGTLSLISGVGRGVGLDRVPGDLSIYGLRLVELVVPSMGSIAFGSHFDAFLGRHMHGSNLTETSNYLGLLTMLLALAWLVIAARRWDSLSARLRTATVGLVGVFVAALLLAAPSPILLAGHRIWMPSRLMWEIVPAIRVPSRWVALLMTALVPLAALALQAAARRLERAPLRRVAPAALIALAAVVSFLELAIYPARPRVRTHPVPAEYAGVAKTPKGILAEYPIDLSEDYLFWQSIHQRPILNGPPVFPAEYARQVLVDPAVPGTASKLSLLGVTAIVTHADALDYLSSNPDVPNASWGPGYSLVTRARDGSSLWRVVAPPAPALVTLRGGFGSPTPPRGTFVGYPFDSPSGVGALEFWSKKAQVVQLSFDAAPPNDSSKVLRLADNHVERPFTLDGRTRVRALVQIPRGHSLLLVKTDPPPTSDENAILIGAPVAGVASGQPAFRAQQISAQPGF